MEGMLLVLMIGTEIKMFRIQEKRFNLFTYAPSEMMPEAAEWLERHGHERMVSFDPDDKFSGLYTAETQL